MTDTREPYDYPEDWDPESVLVQGLLAEELGQLYDEQEMAEAALTLAAASLMSQGVSESLAIACVDQALEHGDIHIGLSADGRLTVVIGEPEDD